MNLKNIIKRQFDKSCDTYDTHCYLQNEICDRSIQLVKKYVNFIEVIADFACGTGESTLRLVQSIGPKRCYAVDFSEKLLSVAARKLPFRAYPILADFENSLFKTEVLDLVFCNMGLQWALHLEKTLSLFRSYLNHAGHFVFSLPVEGNFPEIKKGFKYPLFTQGDILACLKQCEFKVLESSLHHFVCHFQSHKEALFSLKKVGANVSFQQGIRIPLREVFREDCIFPKLTYCIGIYVCKR